MARKIYDIKPPKLAKKVEKEIKEFLAEKKPATRVHRTERPAVARRKKEFSFPWAPVLGAVLLVVILLGGFLFVKLPKADVSIWPKVENLSYKETVVASKSAGEINVAKLSIPAQYLEASKTETQDFPATGNADNSGKASGTITVYNKSNISYLKAGTHFLSDSGKLFKASVKIVLPAPKKVGGKVTPGSVTVTVEAVEGGEAYNISPANFSVPGLKGTADYYNIYAVSTKAMAGGSEGKVKKVTDDDIQQAKDALVKKAGDGAVDELKKQISSDYVLLDNALTTNTVDASTKTKAGTITDNFSYQATVKAVATVFKKSDLDKFVKDYIVSKMPDGKTLLDSSLKTNYSASTVDISGGKATLNVEFSGGLYQNIEKNSVAMSLQGKDAGQIKDFLASEFGDSIDKTQIKLWPFWVTRAPNSQKAVHVDLKF